MLALLQGRKSAVGNRDDTVPALYVNKQEVRYLFTLSKKHRNFFGKQNTVRTIWFATSINNPTDALSRVHSCYGVSRILLSQLPVKIFSFRYGTTVNGLFATPSAESHRFDELMLQPSQHSQMPGTENIHEVFCNHMALPSAVTFIPN